MRHKSLPLLVLTLLFYLSLAACAQTKQLAQNLPRAKSGTSLLWQISGNGLQQPSYLYGTVHIIDSTSFFWPATYQKAFDSTRQLVTEVDLSTTKLQGNTAIIQRMMLPNNKTLSDLYPPKQYDTLRLQLQRLNIPLMIVARMQPLFTQQMVIMKKKRSANNMVSYEVYLTNLAKAEGHSLGGLETALEQMEIIDSIPESQQAKMLYETVMNLSSQRNEMNHLYKFYRAQQLDSLSVLINGEMSDTSTEKRLLLVHRNRRWIPTMEKMMKTEPIFFAVGAGHLPGKIGVIHLLRQAGYTVLPVQAKGSALERKYMGNFKTAGLKTK